MLIVIYATLRINIFEMNWTSCSNLAAEPRIKNRFFLFKGGRPVEVG